MKRVTSKPAYLIRGQERDSPEWSSVLLLETSPFSDGGHANRKNDVLNCGENDDRRSMCAITDRDESYIRQQAPEPLFSDTPYIVWFGTISI